MPGEGMTALWREFGFSRKTGYKLLLAPTLPDIKVLRGRVIHGLGIAATD